MPGLIHIYTGDGKGKTSAAAGLALRFAGSGGKVLFAQFLKDGTSGEVQMLRRIAGVEVLVCRQRFGFTFQMRAEEKAAAAAAYEALFLQAIQKAEADCGLLVLDEVLGACAAGLLSETALLRFLREKPAALEVVLTGRGASKELRALADYISVIQKEKHPFDRGIAARRGVEY